MDRFDPRHCSLAKGITVKYGEQLFFSFALASLGLLPIPVLGQSNLSEDLRDAAAGAVRGAITGRGDVGKQALRGAVRGFAGANSFSYRNRTWHADGYPPRLDDRGRPDAKFDEDFRRRFGPNANRDRFRYSDDAWWYQTGDNDWIYDRYGEWHYRDGRPYAGYDARHVGNRHPNYRFHDDFWWYNTGNDWVFFDSGQWFRSDGRFYAPPREGLSANVGPLRVDLFVGNDGRRYRYHNDRWWYRDGGDWFYQRDGYWYDQLGQRTRQVDRPLQQQLQSHRQRASNQKTSSGPGDVNASGSSDEMPSPPAMVDSPETADGRDARFKGQLPSAPPNTAADASSAPSR